jgi:hypothetical protein
MSDIRACSGVASMTAGGVISSLGTMRDDQLFILGRLSCRRPGQPHSLRRGLGWLRNVSGRLLEYVGQFVQDGIARQAKLAQDFSDDTHNLGQPFGADDNQRDREDESYFKKIRQISMTADKCNSMTSRGAEKFHATAPCQLIIIPDWGVNDA